MHNFCIFFRAIVEIYISKINIVINYTGISFFILNSRNIENKLVNFYQYLRYI